jgi:hypothetical protein
MKIIHRLREKSYEEKRRLAFGIATVSTFFIFIVWLVGVNALSSNDTITNEPAASLSPLGDLKNALGPIIHSFRN